MIPKCKHYTFTASLCSTGGPMRGIVLAPTKHLARLNVYHFSPMSLYNVKIGGVKRTLTEEQKKSQFLVNGG